MSEPKYLLEQSIRYMSVLKGWQEEKNDFICEHLKFLRNSCPRGSEYQLKIAECDNLLRFLEGMLFPNTDPEQDTGVQPVPEKVRLIAGQLLANIIVNNQTTRAIVWQRFGAKILRHCIMAPKRADFYCNLNTFLMILYNVHISRQPRPQFNDDFKDIMDYNDMSPMSLILRSIVCVWQAISIKQSNDVDIEYLHFLFEVFLVKDAEFAVVGYHNLKHHEERLFFLDYVTHYLNQESPNGPVHLILLQHFSTEFKRKSDSILRQSSLQQIDDMQPREVYALLKVLAIATGSECYSSHYAKDQSLFLNVSSLLRCLVKLGKNGEQIYKPMIKLEEVAPCSNLPADFENEVTFELKTLLTRCTANLLHKNRSNKQYCIETKLIPALLECTNLDARNPMIREWSILAIRNACEDCPEIQNIVANIAKVDDFTDNKLNMEIFRIKP